MMEVLSQFFNNILIRFIKLTAIYFKNLWKWTVFKNIIKMLEFILNKSYLYNTQEQESKLYLINITLVLLDVTQT